MRNKIDRWTVTGTLILGTMLFLTGALEDGHIDASDVRSAGVFLAVACLLVVLDGCRRWARERARQDGYDDGYRDGRSLIRLRVLRPSAGASVAVGRAAHEFRQ